MKYNTTRQSMYDFWYILCLPTVREPNKKGDSGSTRGGSRNTANQKDERPGGSRNDQALGTDAVQFRYRGKPTQSLLTVPGARKTRCYFSIDSGIIMGIWLFRLRGFSSRFWRAYEHSPDRRSGSSTTQESFIC